MIPLAGERRLKQNKRATVTLDITGWLNGSIKEREMKRPEWETIIKAQCEACRFCFIDRNMAVCLARPFRRRYGVDWGSIKRLSMYFRRQPVRAKQIRYKELLEVG